MPERNSVEREGVYYGEADNRWAGVKLLESLGAGTCNPVADLTLPMLAAIRSVSSIPFDIHIQLWSSMGGYNRIYETPEIARVASPCYFKMETGTSMAMYMSWSTSEEGLAQLGREKIRSIKNIIELIGETKPELKVSNQEAGDLRVPLPVSSK